jgi:hypothetical protein
LPRPRAPPVAGWPVISAEQRTLPPPWDRPGGLTLTAGKWSHQGPMAASKFITAMRNKLASSVMADQGSYRERTLDIGRRSQLHRRFISERERDWSNRDEKMPLAPFFMLGLALISIVDAFDLNQCNKPGLIAFFARWRYEGGHHANGTSIKST